MPTMLRGYQFRRLSKAIVAVGCVTSCPTVAPAQSNPDPKAVVRAWAESRGVALALELDWEESVPRLESADPSGVDIYFSKYIMRWPDCLYTSRELVRTEESGNVIDYRTDEDPLVRARRELDLSESFITPDGSFIQRSEGIKGFNVIAGPGSVSLEAAFSGYVMHAPAILAGRLVNDSNLELFDISSDESGHIRVTQSDPNLAFVLATDDSESGEFVLKRIEYLDSEGVVKSAYEYRDFHRVESCPYPIPRFRAEYRPSETRVTRKDGRPVGIEYYGEIKEVSVDRLVSCAVFKTLPDDVFTPNLEGYSTLDASSGRLLDSEGNLLAKTAPKRKIGRSLQWSTLIGAGGAALIVFAAGAWWIRRRAA